MSGQLRSIQVLRAVAACAVVLFHAHSAQFGHDPASAFLLGAAGVDLFFVISGFIIATVAPGRDPAAFMADRVWRIVPLWLLAVWPFAIHWEGDWAMLAASLTLWPVYDAFTFPALTLGWTLSFEMLFYTAAAAALWSRPAAPLAVFGVCLCGGVLTDHPLFDFLGNPILFEFLFGVAIARLPRRERLALPLLAVAAAWLALAPLWVFHAEVAVAADLSAYRVVAWGMPAALIVYAMLSLERHFASPLAGPAVLIGGASYSIYLFHVFVGRMIDLHWLAEAAVMTLAGVVVYFLLEYPLMGLRRELKTRRGRRGGTPAGDGGGVDWNRLETN